MPWPVALAPHARTSAILPVALGWDELRLLLTDPVVHHGPKEALAAWIPALMREDERGGFRRASCNVVAVSCLVLDLDSGEPLERVLTLAGKWVALYHTSWSHRPEHPKGRLVFPFAEPAPVERWGDVWAAASRWAASCGLTVDPATKDPARLYFVPAVPYNDPHRRRDFRGGSQGGEWLTWRRLIVDWPAPELPRRHAPVQPVRMSGLPGQDQQGPRRIFAASVINTRCREISGTPTGGRNIKVFRAAAAAARLCAAGVLDIEEARAAIAAAALNAGLAHGEIQTTINSGIARGRKDGSWQF